MMMMIMTRLLVLFALFSVASTRELSRFFEEQHSTFGRALLEPGWEPSLVYEKRPPISANEMVQTLKSAMQGGPPVVIRTDDDNENEPDSKLRSKLRPPTSVSDLPKDTPEYEESSPTNGALSATSVSKEPSPKEASPSHKPQTSNLPLPPKSNLRSQSAKGVPLSSPSPASTNIAAEKASVPTINNPNSISSNGLYSTTVQRKIIETSEPKPQFDFVVAGFPKCGTTTLLKAFADHPETDMFGSEQCAIAAQAQADPLVLKKLDETLSFMQNDDMKRSFKCPTAMYNYKSIIRMEKHSPNAKFVVGIRHPVKMMQSFYNYRVTELYERGLDEAIPDFVELAEKWNEPWKGVSMLSVRFELFLQQLGKTVMSPNDLLELSQATEAGYELAVKPSNFTVFLYTVDQLEDEDETRSARLRSELQRYLGLTVPLAPFGHENKNHKVGDSGHPESIHICDPEFASIRKRLVDTGVKTAAWLRDHFLKSSDVIVANPEHFVETLDTWSVDPCEDDYLTEADAVVVSDPVPDHLLSTEHEPELIYNGAVDIMV